MIAAAITVIAFGLARLRPSTHRIYYDENICLHIDQTIAATGKAQMVNFGGSSTGSASTGANTDSPTPTLPPEPDLPDHGRAAVLPVHHHLRRRGIPHLLLGFLLRRVQIGLTPRRRIVIPQNILWHNTTAAEPANTAAIILTVLLAYCYIRTSKPALLFLAFVAAAFAAQFRMETLLVFPLLRLCSSTAGRSSAKSGLVRCAARACSSPCPSSLCFHDIRGGRRRPKSPASPTWAPPRTRFFIKQDFPALRRSPPSASVPAQARREAAAGCGSSLSGFSSSSTRELLLRADIRFPHGLPALALRRRGPRTSTPGRADGCGGQGARRALVIAASFLVVARCWIVGQRPGPRADIITHEMLADPEMRPSSATPTYLLGELGPGFDPGDSETAGLRANFCGVYFVPSGATSPIRSSGCKSILTSSH
jgi:hypothetical protein